MDGAIRRHTFENKKLSLFASFPFKSMNEFFSHHTSSEIHTQREKEEKEEDFSKYEEIVCI